MKNALISSFFLVCFYAVQAQSNDTIFLFKGHSLDDWNITNYGPQGPVYMENNQIILGIGDGLTGITWKKAFPTENYEIHVEAKKLNGTDFFCGLTFPVYDEHATFIAGGWGGALVGLSSIDGKDASENELRSFIAFDADRWYHFRIRMANDSIKAWIDDEQVIDFKKGNHEISLRSDIDLSKPLGISAWNTKSAIRKVYYFTVSGNE